MEDYGLISVIIPVYNSEKYIKECVDSVLAQTYKNYEILLIDDGSIDNSLSICNEYAKADSRVKVFHKENGGASSARNVGLDKAHGDYVYFLDSDDYIVTQTLEKCVVCARQNNADLVFFDGSIISEGESYGGDYTHKRHYETNLGYKLMEELLLNNEFHVGTPFFFISVGVFRKNKLRFKEGVMYEDMLMSYQLFTFAQYCAHLDEKLYVRRYRENSVMTTKLTSYNYSSIVDVFNSMIKFSANIEKNKVQNKHIVRCAYNVINIYYSLNREDRNKYKDTYEVFKKTVLDNNAFSDISLKMRCYGYLPWFIYKSFTKVFGR